MVRQIEQRPNQKEIHSSGEFSASEAVRGWAELQKIRPWLKEQQTVGVENFWQSHKAEIIAGLKEIYQITDSPDVEVMSPVHKNYADLPLLLLGLSKQKITSQQSVQLTVCMHNNVDHPEWKMQRDKSWDIIDELKAAGVPIKVITLDDPLLTGPYLSWQYLLRTSKAKFCAVLDADSIVPSSWLERITKPFKAHPTADFTGGVRDIVGSQPSIEIPARLYYLLTTVRAVFDKKGPNLAQVGRFAGGQAAYKMSEVSPFLDQMLGLPQGDGSLAYLLLNNKGANSFAFADAPVLNRVDSYRSADTLQEYLSKIKYASRAIIPRRIHKYFNLEITYGAQDHLATLDRYCPWSRVIIRKFNTQGSLSGKEMKHALQETAETFCFMENKYVLEFLTKNFKELYTTPDEILEFCFYFAKACIRPTMVDHMETQGSSSN